MSSKPTRETLQSMKRQDLQKLCKDYGLKANLKSEALIDQIMDAPNLATGISGAPRSRSTSVAVAKRDGARSRDRSTGSMIIHGDSEDEHLSPADEPHSTPDPELAVARSTRTRKAKDTQFRLGVGRPVVAGGSGARAVTRASNSSKTRRGKTRSYQTTEVPIPEEPEPQGIEVSPLPVNSSPDPGPSTSNQASKVVDENPPTTASLLTTSSGTLEVMNEYLAKLVRPLEEKLEHLSAQIARTEEMKQKMDSMTAELESLRIQVTSIQERQDATDVAYNQLPSTPQFSTPNLTPAIPRHTNVSSALGDDDASNSLGKRHRGSPHADGTHGQDAGASLSPKKRVRLSTPEPPAGLTRAMDSDSGPVAGPSSQADSSSLSAPFVVFTGLDGDERGNAQPEARSSQRLTTTSADASENQPPVLNDYDFSLNSAAFDPITSTPYVAHFPPPQPPLSPTPNMPPSGGTVDRHGRRDRVDRYHPFGTPARPRARAADAGTSTTTNGFINPLALMRTPSPSTSNNREKASSNEVGAGLGLGRPPIPDTPALPIRRTMYGTELDNDHRFGDFGVEGVATGFWNPAKYHPTSEDFDS